MASNDLSELLSPQGPNQNAWNAIIAATVHAVMGAEVSVTIDGFPSDEVYAVVPWSGGTPTAGATVTLFHDSNGNPISALVPHG
jgi:hypothetical protein